MIFDEAPQRIENMANKAQPKIDSFLLILGENESHFAVDVCHRSGVRYVCIETIDYFYIMRTLGPIFIVDIQNHNTSLTFGRIPGVTRTPSRISRHESTDTH